MLETVCIVVASLLSVSVAIAGFLERFSPMLAKKSVYQVWSLFIPNSESVIMSF